MENNGSEDDTSQNASFNTDHFTTNVELKNGSSNEDLIIERKRRRGEMIEQKRLAEEQYQRELQDQQYKRLMHLLNRSKFYSSYIVNKINNNNFVKDTHKTSKADQRKVTFNDENTPPQEKGKKKSQDIRNYISKDVQEKIRSTNNKLNLSGEQNGETTDNDFEDKIQTNDDATFETPKYFNGNLREYQMEGLQWLKVLYENGLNGILADEMGLGKTVQVIALLCHLIEKRQDGPYLLIAPLSTIPNWMLEFDRFAPKLPVVLFHGPQSEKDALKKKIKQKYKITESYRTLPIVLTSFDVPLQERNFIQSFNWRYIIIDEGHRIKNHECQLVKLLRNCNSMNRLLLTGTPLQNNLAELWSLLNFLLPEIFNDLAVFESWFNAKEFQEGGGKQKFLQLEEEKHILSSLREILQPFMLRREKSDVCLDIPPKKELVVYAPLTQLQHDLYKAVLNCDIDKLKEIEETALVYGEDGTRPKRRCVLRNMNNNSNGSTYSNFQQDTSQTTLLPESGDSTDSDTWKQNIFGDETNLIRWSRFIEVTDLNREFLTNIKIKKQKVLTYKKIVNHPYLIYCPPKIDEDLVKASGKLLVLDIMLSKLKKRGHKVLLFSTMTMLLDVIEDYLYLRSYKYVRLDGQTDLLVRKENINAFNTDPEIFLFLISTRAGGVGLNLVGADTVIIYDSDWNPQADIQAMARCHRIGQKLPVVIYKFCTKGTIDETIINRAEAKRLLEKVVISKEARAIDVRNKTHLNELKKLLESKDCQIVKSENEIFTEEELNKLLDRSDLYAQQKKS